MQEQLTNDLLSELTVFMKYSKYIDSEKRRESWVELVNRNMQMHIDKFPNLKKDIEWAYKYVLSKKVLPSMRSMQFAGKPVDINPVRMFNCSYMAMDDYRSFQELMFLLLSGCGVGISVQLHHISKLPKIYKPIKSNKRRYVVGDSITGWSDAIKALMKSYFGIKSVKYEFDYLDIREKGSMLITSGGKAPGAEPLKRCIESITAILENKNNGEALTSIEVFDISCHIADAVLAGGIRRAAMITLFSLSDKKMMESKNGEWWVKNPQRARSNNSVSLVRSRLRKSTFEKVFNVTKESKSGEPGFYLTNSSEMGCNPCCEISLRNMQFCNLTEVNASDINSQEEFENRVKAATIIGTLQASYTDFHYLRNDWKVNTEKDALLGVSMTGIASMLIFNLDIENVAKKAIEVNEYYSKLIGINKAKRVTTVKPAGTTSLVMGCSSGIHAWHDKFYIRRIRISKNEPIYTYLSIYHSELIEDDIHNPKTTSVISVPQKAPNCAVTREESAIDLLNRVGEITKRWISPGHIDGYNSHNVSCTISVKDDEWDSVKEWMWLNRDNYNGISILPHSDHTYKQAPFETCTKEKYDELLKNFRKIDLSLVYESEDNTNFIEQAACAGGSCELK